MSELHQPTNEVSKETKDLEKAIAERLEATAKSPEASKVEQASETSSEQLESIREKINETATKKSEFADDLAAPVDASRQQVYIDKVGARKAKLQEVQSNLSGGERTFSKVIHNKAVNAVSTSLSNTIARPTGVFWGGLFACLATGGLYFTAKYIGFQYNYLISLISFVGGYLAGLLVELSLRLARRPSAS